MPARIASIDAVWLVMRHASPMHDSRMPALSRRIAITDEDSDVRQVFDSQSHSYYQRNYGALAQGVNASVLRRRREIMMDLAGTGTTSVLELGCGPAALTAGLIRSGHKVVASDLSPRMLEAGRTMLMGQGLSAPFCAGRCPGLPFRSEAFDEVIAAGVLEYLPDVGTGLAEIARVLKPGGRAFISFPIHRIWYERAAKAGARWLPVIRTLLGIDQGRSRSNPRLQFAFAHARFRPRGVRRLLTAYHWTVLRIRYHHFVFTPLDLLLPKRSVEWSLALERRLPEPLQPLLAKSMIIEARRP